MPQNATYIQAQNPWFGYPFGMTMEKRTVSEGKFGFNGKEKDTDFAEGVYDFGANYVVVITD
ncbi:MAG: hypothetical protein BWY22_01471 [Bacteroidetes bacterium ADurb.Bin217]|nr:MAG: hypothetical protein BWY22_01471 [Bacteroidetes bacterium ADurb.Bin217]